MRQYRKGRRLLALNEQKTDGAQRRMARLQAQRKALMDRVAGYDAELGSLQKALIGLHIQERSITRADIYRQRKKQVILLRQRQQLLFDRNICCEELAEVNLDIGMQQTLLAELKRKEAKFSRWTQHGKQLALRERDRQSDDDDQDLSVLKVS